MSDNTPTRDRQVIIRDGDQEWQFFREEDATCDHKWVPWDMEYGGSTCSKCDGWHFIRGAR